MTAVNIFVKRERILIFTDGAIYDPDGTLLELGNKVALIPHLNCAVATRGSFLALPLLARRLSVCCETFDALAENFGEIATDITLEHGRDLDTHGNGRVFEALLAGFSEQTGCPTAYHVETSRPDNLTQIPIMWSCPGDEDFAVLIRSTFPRARSELDFANEFDGVKLMELQRRTKFRSWVTGEMMHGVGGFCQLTTLTKNGATTRILKRWPDKIGEPLGGGESSAAVSHQREDLALSTSDNSAIGSGVA